jgi:hypothetical protein
MVCGPSPLGPNIEAMITHCGISILTSNASFAKRLVVAAQKVVVVVVGEELSKPCHSDCTVIV